MFYGSIILILSMVLAIMIRIKKCEKSCLMKKILPYLVLFIGGIFATYIVLINK